LYGIRSYSRGAMVAPHVDRLPLVLSAIINVAQDVTEPWPLKIYGHDGNVYNVTLEEGDMLLYESHSVIHGRPYSLNGDSYDEIFVHFEPQGHCIKHMIQREREQIETNVEEVYESSRKKLVLEVDVQDDLPDYISNEKHRRWKQQLKYESSVEGYFPRVKPKGAGLAASRGHYQTLLKLSETDPLALSEKDANVSNACYNAYLKYQFYVIDKDCYVDVLSHHYTTDVPLCGRDGCQFMKPYEQVIQKLSSYF